jgi:pyruvate formate lyase activating enzyme
MTEGERIKTVGKDVTVGEIMPELLSDLPYYRRSGGGITLSGGEILCQREFAKALLMACHENGLHTAVESTGFSDFEKIKELLPYIDLFLMDIKHVNPEKHKEFTGVSCEIILENARKIAENVRELIIRTPVVPGFNDTKEEIAAIASFASSLPGVLEHHLLPYHRLGSDKYKGLGRYYSLSEINPPSKEKMNYLLSVAEEYGLKCQIGG